MKRYVLFFLFLFAFSQYIYSQTIPASVKWPLTDSTKGGTGYKPVVSGLLNASNETFVNTDMNGFTGYNSSQRVRIKGNTWPGGLTNQIDSVYIQFSVTPKSNINFIIKNFSVQLGSNSTNTMRANIWYSTDPAFISKTQLTFNTGISGNYLKRDSLVTYNFPLDLKISDNETFYVRIYPWHENASQSTGKYMLVQNVEISGEMEALPTPVKVVWPQYSDELPVTTGPVLANNPFYSSMKLYQYTSLPLNSTSGPQTKVAAIQTSIKTWNAEPKPVDSMYMQYTVKPKKGGTLFLDSGFVYIGGWYSNTIYATIFGSKDSSFSKKTTLVPDFNLVGNYLAPVSWKFNDTILPGEEYYIRIYPHNSQAQGWAKLVAICSLSVYGKVSGVTSDPPVLTTAPVTDISTTFATSGGNISSDGGSNVTARGVCYNTIGSPTINDLKTNDGTGTGSFVSYLKNLNKGTKYYIRAYATNDAGTSYGEEISFTTLDSISVPTVITKTTSNLLAKSVSISGEVTAWGGDTVKLRGICWSSTKTEPTINDNKTENGSGLGSFTGILYPLEPNTKYYARAYAQNSKGIGYGEIITFNTPSLSAPITKVVSKDGTGDYSSVQAAFNDVPDYYNGTYTILIKKGTYKEKLLLPASKVNVILKGEDKNNTILTYDDYAGKAGGTSNSYSVAIDASDFIAYNLTFQNTVKNDGSFSDQQGVALRVNGDRMAFYNCNLKGYQDTYYTWGGSGTGRVYMKNCYIEGSVDFIFGRDVVVFDSCRLHVNRDGGTITAASTDATSKFGYVFRNCVITADSVGFDGKVISKIFLGRPWQSAPRTVFMFCSEPSVLDPAGWQTWNVTPGLYAEYKCIGSGFSPSTRISIGKQLSDNEASEYTLKNIFSKNTHPNFGYDWLPDTTLKIVNVNSYQEIIPTEFELKQNYPNPFNPTTKIVYSIPKSSKVILKVYNMLGQEVSTLVNDYKNAGKYEIEFNANNLSTGVYFYKIQADNFTKCMKMVLLK